jgi:hypothetical protein
MGVFIIQIRSVASISERAVPSPQDPGAFVMAVCELSGKQEIYYKKKKLNS